MERTNANHEPVGYDVMDFEHLLLESIGTAMIVAAGMFLQSWQDKPMLASSGAVALIVVGRSIHTIVEHLWS